MEEDAQMDGGVSVNGHEALLDKHDLEMAGESSDEGGPTLLPAEDKTRLLPLSLLKQTSASLNHGQQTVSIPWQQTSRKDKKAERNRSSQRGQRAVGRLRKALIDKAPLVASIATHSTISAVVNSHNRVVGVAVSSTSWGAKSPLQSTSCGSKRTARPARSGR